MALESAKLVSKPRETFTVGYLGGSHISELNYARLVSGHIGSVHHELGLDEAHTRTYSIPSSPRWSDGSEPLASRWASEFNPMGEPTRGGSEYGAFRSCAAESLSLVLFQTRAESGAARPGEC